MRNRGQAYWEWADAQLHFRNLDERLPCGTLINIQVRTSFKGVTQLFIGVYGQQGLMLLEEYFPDCRGQTMTAAMTWGLQRANEWIAHTSPPAPSSQPGSPGRRGSRSCGK